MEITHAWCDGCKRIQPVTFEGYVLDNGEYVGGDVVCSVDYFVIATLCQPKPVPATVAG